MAPSRIARTLMRSPVAKEPWQRSTNVNSPNVSALRPLVLLRGGAMAVFSPESELTHGDVAGEVS